MTPERIQLRRQKGWRMPPNTVKVDRSTVWGNPFHTHADGYPMDKGMAVQLFKEQLEKAGGYIGRGRTLVELPDIRQALRGFNLACWCPLAEQCHADILLQIANS